MDQSATKNSKQNIMEMMRKFSETGNDHANMLKLAVQAIKTRILTICDVVEGLRNLLINEKPIERAQGTKFMSDVLQLISDEYINEEELKFILLFYIDRLKDHHSVIPYVLQGFLVIMCHKNLSEDGVISLLQALFKDVHCQSQVMTDRRVVFNILKQSLIKRKSYVLKIETSFLLGFINAMDGEKDPRNLVLLFSIIPIIAMTFSLEKLNEDIFEVVAAYFPIDFVPPKSDPFGISPDDLILGLRNCLSSTDSFAAFCIPLLIEKLESDIAAAKMDSLLTLISCCRSYSSDSMSVHVLVLWNSLKRELIEGMNPDIEREALNSLSALVQNLEKGPVTSTARDALNKLGSLSMSECLIHLSRPDQRLMQPSTSILFAVSSSSRILTKNVCLKALPILLEQADTKKELIAQRNVFLTLAKFLQQSASFQLFEDDHLRGYRDETFTIFLNELSSNNVSCIFVTADAIQLCSQSLNEIQKDNLTVKLLSLIINSSERDIRQKLTDTLISLDRIDKEILTVVINEIEADSDCKNKMDLNLELLSRLSVHSSIGLELVWIKIWTLFRTSFDKDDPNAVIFINCLIKMTESCSENEIVLNTRSDANFLSELVSFLIMAISSSNFPDLISIMQKVSFLGRLKFSRSDPKCVMSVIITILDSKWEECDPELTEALSNLSEDKSSLFIFIFELTLSLQSMIGFEYFDRMLTVIQNWALFASESRVRESAAILVSAHLNKLLSDVDLEKYVNNIVDRPIWTFSSVRLLGWIVKAVIMRGHIKEASWISILEGLLLHEEFGQEAAQCYKFMLEDQDHIYDAQLGSVVRMLYKQRYFESRLLILVEQFRNYRDKAKFNTFLAISYLLPHVPSIVLHRHLKMLLPVLVQGLSFNDHAVVNSSVGTLNLLLKQSAKDVSSHVADLLPPLIKLSTSYSMLTRMESLSCLASLADLPSLTIVPYKPSVLSGLKGALNDRKRMVRTAATTAKCAWVLV